jgi:hypothetical protein
VKRVSLKIWVKVFVGFGIILALLFIIAGVGTFNLIDADHNFKAYRSLARQTNAGDVFRRIC